MLNYQRLKTDEKFLHNIKMRTRLIKLIREFFDARDFLEVETPSVVKLPGMEPYLDPFETSVIDLNGKKNEAFLITSPEYCLKKLLVGGMERIYQICKAFRNKEDWSGSHNPEFTMIEWYRAHSDYSQIIKDTVDLMKFLCDNINESLRFSYLGKTIDLEKSEIITMDEALRKYAGVSLDKVSSMQNLSQTAKDKGYEVSDSETYEDIFYKIFLNEVEPNLGKGTLTVLKDFPLQLSSLSQLKKGNENIAERFECYIEGIELCNGFSELTDPHEQKQRLEEERKLRAKLGRKDYEVDGSFIKALELGMPPSGGVALGVDRVIMLFTDSKDIRDVLLFPMGDIMEP